MSPSSRISACLSVLLLVACATRGPDLLPDPLVAGWMGKPVCEQLHNDARMRILRCTFPPGVGHEPHYHDPHFGYVIRGGKMQINADGEVRVVDIPDASMWTRETRTTHDVVNIGDTTAVYLIIERFD